jgi:hypothetical protein
MSNLYLVNTPDSVRTIQSGVDSTTRVVRSNFSSGSSTGIIVELIIFLKVLMNTIIL